MRAGVVLVAMMVGWGQRGAPTFYEYLDARG
jgi:hypothetical protein